MDMWNLSILTKLILLRYLNSVASINEYRGLHHVINTFLRLSVVWHMWSRYLRMNTWNNIAITLLFSTANCWRRTNFLERCRVSTPLLSTYGTAANNRTLLDRSCSDPWHWPFWHCPERTSRKAVWEVNGVVDVHYWWIRWKRRWKIGCPRFQTCSTNDVWIVLLQEKRYEVRNINWKTNAWNHHEFEKASLKMYNCG